MRKFKLREWDKQTYRWQSCQIHYHFWHTKNITGQLVYRETFLAALMTLKSNQPTPSDDADSIFPPPLKFKMLISPLDGLGVESGLGRDKGGYQEPQLSGSMARSWGIPGPGKNYNIPLLSSIRLKSWTIELQHSKHQISIQINIHTHEALDILMTRFLLKKLTHRSTLLMNLDFSFCCITRVLFCLRSSN